MFRRGDGGFEYDAGEVIPLMFLPFIGEWLLLSLQVDVELMIVAAVDEGELGNKIFEFGTGRS